MEYSIVHLSDLHFKNDADNRFRIKKLCDDLVKLQRLPLTFELASLATTLGVRHGLVILDAQQYHSGGCLVGGTSVKGGIVFERVLICYGPVGNISASSGLFILLDMAR